jgi:hypothetical protein
MEAFIAQSIVSGGATGIVIGVLVFLYKCCYKKKFHSECCGNTLDVKDSEPSPETTPPPQVKT